MSTEKPRDFEAEHARDALQALGEHIIDGLPVRTVQSAASRREEAEGQAALAKARAERDAAAGEALTTAAKILEVQQQIEARERALAKEQGAARKKIIDEVCARKGIDPNDARARNKVMRKLARKGRLP